MEHIRLTAISLSLLLCTVSAFAQRHYENIPALELNYGTNLFTNAKKMPATITIHRVVSFDSSTPPE